jgi:hypothetical protein
MWFFLDKVSTFIKFTNKTLQLSYYIIPILTLLWYKFYRKHEEVTINKENNTVDTTDFVDDILGKIKSLYQGSSGNPPTIEKIAKDFYKGPCKNNRNNSEVQWNNQQRNARRVNNTVKKVIASNQKWQCGRCYNLLDASYEIDHVIPLYKGGTNNMDNLMALCRNCHGNKTIEDSMSY